MKPIQETVLVHFIMYYAVLCINSKGTVQSHVNNVTSFLLQFHMHLSVGKVCRFVVTDPVHKNQVKLTSPKHCGPAR